MAMRTPPCTLCCSIHHLLVLQDHIHQMGSCLLQMDGHEDPSVHTTLQRLTSEAMTLVAQLVRTHGKVSGPIMHNGKTPGMDEHMHPQPNDAFYARILVRLLILQLKHEKKILRPSAWVRLCDALETGGVLAAKWVKLKVGRGGRGGEGGALAAEQHCSHDFTARAGTQSCGSDASNQSCCWVYWYPSTVQVLLSWSQTTAFISSS